MKTKLLLAFLIAVGSTLAANAQITTGEPTSKVIRTGNRAEGGDFGLYIGTTSSMFRNVFNDDVTMTPLPLINFKFMTSDNFELRIGLEAYSLKETLEGDINAITSEIQKYGQNTVLLYPGFAYHFSRLNILDVYVGAELPLGWDASKVYAAAEKYENVTTKNSFVLGLGAFIGLQAYIADLPLALGVEYGISSRLDAGLKYKNEVTSQNKTTVSYSPTGKFDYISPMSDTYELLKARKGEIGGQLRITLSYYFK